MLLFDNLKFIIIARKMNIVRIVQTHIFFVDEESQKP